MNNTRHRTTTRQRAPSTSRSQSRVRHRSSSRAGKTASDIHNIVVDPGLIKNTETCVKQLQIQGERVRSNISPLAIVDSAQNKVSNILRNYIESAGANCSPQPIPYSGKGNVMERIIAQLVVIISEARRNILTHKRLERYLSVLLGLEDAFVRHYECVREQILAIFPNYTAYSESSGTDDCEPPTSTASCDPDFALAQVGGLEPVVKKSYKLLCGCAKPNDDESGTCGVKVEVATQTEGAGTCFSDDVDEILLLLDETEEYINEIIPESESDDEIVYAQAGVTQMDETTKQMNTVFEDQRNTITESMDLCKRNVRMVERSIMERRWHTESVLNKALPIKNVQWTTSNPPNFTLAKYVLPGGVLIGQHNAFMQTFTQFKGDMVIDFQINSNKFQQGILLCTYLSYLQTTEKSVVPYNHLCTAPSVMLDAAHSNSGRLVIPFSHMNTYFNLTVNRPWQYIGELNIVVFNPLRAADGVSNSVDVTIWVSFHNTELHLPCRQHKNELPNKLFNDTIKLKNLTLSPVAQIGEGSDTTESGLKEMIHSVTDGGVDLVETFIGRMLNGIFDYPTDAGCFHKMVPTTTGRLAQGKGVDTSVRLALTPKWNLGMCHDDVCNTADDMDLRQIVRLFTRFKVLKWSADDQAEKRIYQFPVGAMLANKAEAKFAGTDVTIWSGSTLSYIGRCFYLWRGSIKIRIQVVSTQMHSGRLMLVYAPGYRSLSYAQASTLNTITLDLQEKHELDVMCPMVAEHPWMRAKSAYTDGQLNDVEYHAAYGTFAIFVQNKLTLPSGTTNSVEINMYIAGGTDFEFAVPYPLTNALGSPAALGWSDRASNKVNNLVERAYAQAGEQAVARRAMSRENRVRSQVMEYSSSFNNSASAETIFTYGGTHISPDYSETIGDSIMDLRTLLKRYQCFYVLQTEMSRVNDRIYCLRFPNSPMIGERNLFRTGTNSSSRGYGRTYLAHFGAMYAFWRGSLRYKAIINSSNPVTMSVVHMPGAVNNYSGDYESMSRADYYALLSSGSVLAETRHQGSLEFEVPFFTNYNRLHTGLSEGNHTLREVTGTVCIFCEAQTSVTLDTEIFQAAGDDFYFTSFRVAPYYITYAGPTDTWHDESNDLTIWNTTELKDTDLPDNNAGEQGVIGETVPVVEDPVESSADGVTVPGNVAAAQIGVAEDFDLLERERGRPGRAMLLRYGSWDRWSHYELLQMNSPPGGRNRLPPWVDYWNHIYDNDPMFEEHPIYFAWEIDHGTDLNDCLIKSCWFEVAYRIDWINAHKEAHEREFLFFCYFEHYFHVEQDFRNPPPLLEYDLGLGLMHPHLVRAESQYLLRGQLLEQYPVGYLWERYHVEAQVFGLNAFPNSDKKLVDDVLPKLETLIDSANRACTSISSTTCRVGLLSGKLKKGTEISLYLMDLLDSARDIYMIFHSDSMATFLVNATCALKHFVLDKATIGLAHECLQHIAEDFSWNDNERAYSQGGMYDELPRVIVSVIAAITGFSIFGGDFKWNGVRDFASSFVSSCRDITWIRNGVTSLAGLGEMLMKIFQPALDWIINKMWPDYEGIKILETRGDEIAQWLNDVDQVHTPAFMDTFEWCVEAHDKLDHMMDQLHSFEKSFLMNPNRARHMVLIRDAAKVLRDVSSKAGRSRLAPPVRIDPYFVYFVGAPRIGKSFLSNRFVVDIGDQLGFQKQGRVYARNVGDPYWSGYRGQPIVIFDDFAQVIDEKHIEGMYSLKSNNAHLLHMAENEDKGRGFVSKVLIGNSNVSFPDCNNVRSIEAFWGRRNLLVEVVVRAQPQPFDIRKIKAGTIDHLGFLIRDPVDSTAEPLSPVLTYAEFLAYAVEDMGDYLANQRTMVNDLLMTMGYESMMNQWNPPFKVQEKMEEINEIVQRDETTPKCVVSMPEPMPPFPMGYADDVDDRSVLRIYSRTSSRQSSMADASTPVKERYVAQAGFETHRDFGDFLEKYSSIPMTARLNICHIFAQIEKYLIRDDIVRMLVPPMENVPGARAHMVELDKALQAYQVDLGDLLAYCYENEVGPTQLACLPIERASLKRRQDEYIEALVCRQSGFLTRFEYFIRDIINRFRRWCSEVSFVEKTQNISTIVGCLGAIGVLVTTIKRNRVMDDVNESIRMIVPYAANESKREYSDELLASEKEVLSQVEEKVVEEPPPVMEPKPPIAAEVQYYQSGGSIRTQSRKKPKIVAQGTADLKAVQVRDNRVIPYLFRIRVCADRTWTMNCYSIVSRIILVNTHFFDYVTDGFEVQHNGEWLYFNYEPTRRYDIEGKDVTLYELDFKWRQFRSNVRHFIKERDLSKYKRINIELVSCAPSGEFILYQTEATRVTNITYYVEKMEREIILQTGWSYRANTKGGDCGAVLVAFAPGIPEKLIGIHCAGTKTSSKAFGTLLTCEILMKALDNFGNQSRLGIPLPEVVSQCGQKVLPMGYFSIVGTISDKESVVVPTDSKIDKTPLFELFGPHETEPAILGTKDKRNLSGLSPMSRAICKYGKNLGDFNQSDLNDITEDMINMTRRWKILREPSILTEQETIEGIAGMEFFDSMNMQSSPGWPYTLQRRGKSGKDGMFEHGMITDPQVRAKFEEREALALKGERCISVWTDCLKDEKRPIAKVRAGKTRLFTIPPVDFTLLCRKYTLDFAATFYYNRNEFFSAVGMDPYSLEWDDWYQRLAANSNIAIAGDFSSFDGNVSAQLLWAICAIVNAWYRDDFSIVREVIFDEICHTVQLCFNCVYISHHGVPSGNPLTVVINTIANAMYMRLAWKHLSRLHAPGMISMIDYHRNVVESMYGDDNVLTIKASVLPWFNQESISEFLEPRGVIYSDELKSGKVIPFRKLSDVSFLKNSIGTVAELGQFKIPLMDKVTLREMLYWYHIDEDILDALEEIVESCFRMLFFYGREMFDAWRDKIGVALEKEQITINMLTFNELREIYHEKFGLGAVG